MQGVGSGLLGRGAVHQLVSGKGRAGVPSGVRVGLGGEFMLFRVFNMYPFLNTVLDFLCGLADQLQLPNFSLSWGILAYA